MDDNKTTNIQALSIEIARLCDERQKYHSEKAQEFGYAKDVLRDITGVLNSLPQSEPLTHSAERSLNKFREFIQSKEEQYFHSDVSSIAYSLGTSIVASGRFVEPNEDLSIIYNSPKPPSFWSPDKKEIYASKLKILDHELARVYLSIWSSFYGTTENPERTALYQMRQLYDHFFGLLAPDENVRSSSYFEDKQNGDPKKVTRKERIHYAANTKVKDSELRGLLLEEVDYVIKLYERLNKAHKRGPLIRQEVEEILNAMNSILEQWIDAICQE